MNSYVANHFVPDHYVWIIVELEVRDSALRSYFVEADISLCYCVDLETSPCSYSCEIQIKGVATFLRFPRTDVELLKEVSVLVGAGVSRLADVRAVRWGVGRAAGTAWWNVITL